MAKKIFIEEDRIPARPTIRQVVSEFNSESIATFVTPTAAGLTHIESIVMGITSNLRRAPQSGRTGRKVRRTRTIAISSFEEVRFELEITLVGGSGKINNKKVNGGTGASFPAPRHSKRIRKSSTRKA